MKIGTCQWVIVCENIRRAGSPNLNRRLDAFFTRYCATDKHCWVPAERAAIASAWKTESEGQQNATENRT